MLVHVLVVLAIGLFLAAIFWGEFAQFFTKLSGFLIRIGGDARAWFVLVVASLGIVTYLGTIPHNRPSLNAEWSLGYGGTTDFRDPGAHVLVFASVTNSGGVQSIARNWRLTAEVNGKPYTAHTTTLSHTMTITTQGTSVTYFADDALYERANTPIPVGGVVQGILLFVFPTLEQNAFAPGTRFTFTYEDAFKDRYSSALVSGGPSQPIGYLPGLHQQLNPVNQP